MTDYRPTNYSLPTPTSCTSAKASSRALCRARSGLTKPISQPPPICCCSHPDIDLDKELPDLIRRYNESVGGVNSDTRRLSRHDHPRVLARRPACF